MELRQLASFLAVMETGTFVAAARQRNVAQPALWAQVKALEAELNVALFERDGRRVRPTVAARLLAERARLVLDDTRALSTLAEEIRRGRAAPARIGTAEYHVPHFLAGCIAQLRRRHPEAALPEIVPVTTATASESLRRGEVDLVVNVRDPTQSFEGIPLYPVWIAVVGAGVDGGEVDLATLDRRPVATFPHDSGVRRIFEEACAATGVRPRVVHEHRSASSLLALAEHGLATAVLISEALPRATELRAGRLVAGGRRFETELWLCWRREETLSEAARQLRNAMREMAEQYRRERG